MSNTKANELSQGVAQAAELLATKEAQLRQLQAYREDYLRRSSGTASGTDPMLLQNFRAFLERLGEAIRLQAQAVEVARGDYETKRSAWAAVRVEAAALGKAFGMKVVAEGIDNPEALALLRKAGCEIGQGNWFSPALDIERVSAWIEIASGAIRKPRVA